MMNVRALQCKLYVLCGYPPPISKCLVLALHVAGPLLCTGSNNR